MSNSEIAAVFREIADLLERRKDSWFKIRAYRRAADAVEQHPAPVECLASENRLQDIPGVGEAIARKIAELVDTGKLEFLERLKSEMAQKGK